MRGKVGREREYRLPFIGLSELLDALCFGYGLGCTIYMNSDMIKQPKYEAIKHMNTVCPHNFLSLQGLLKWLKLIVINFMIILKEATAFF